MTLTREIPSSTTPAQPPTLSAKGKASLDALLATKLAEKRTPAIYFGATTKDEELYFEYGGDRVYGEPEKGPVDEDTILHYYSMTKLVTVTALLQLVDRGLVSLTDPDAVTTHLPELASLQVLLGYHDAGVAQWKQRSTPLTLTHILSHTSGLGYNWNSRLLARWEKEVDHPSRGAPHAGIETITEPLLFEPGTRWKYGIGIDWAGVLIERLTGQSLEEYCQANIFRPLGMSSATFIPTPEVQEHFMQICKRNDDGSLSHTTSSRNLDPSTIKLISAGGGLFGQPRDYLRFLRGVLASRDPGGILSPESYARLFENVLPPPGTGTVHADLARTAASMGYHDCAYTQDGTGRDMGHSVGLCLNLVDSAWGRKAGSGCWDGIARSHYWIDPTTGIAGICFTQLMAKDPEYFTDVYNAYERALYDALEA